jgi:hypothetical protein
LILMHSSFATLDSRSMNLLLACHPIFHSDDWGYQMYYVCLELSDIAFSRYGHWNICI